MTALTLTACVKVFLSSPRFALRRAFLNLLCCLFLTGCTVHDETCTWPLLNKMLRIGFALSGCWSLGAMIVVNAEVGDPTAQFATGIVELSLFVPVLFALVGIFGLLGCAVLILVRRLASLRPGTAVSNADPQPVTSRGRGVEAMI